MSKITLTSVSELCNHLVLKGEKPSVRKIQEKLGGSFTTISGYLKEWRNEINMASKSQMDISSELTNSLMAEFAKIAQKAESRLQKQIEDLESYQGELEEELKKVSHALLQKEQDNEALKKQLEKEHMEYAKSTAGFESTIKYLNDEKRELQKRLAEAQEKRHQAELKEAIANTKAEALEKQRKDSKKN